MIAWRCLRFDELSAREVYEFMRLRSEVFVVEQRCVYLDADGADPACWHLLGESDGELHRTVVLGHWF